MTNEASETQVSTYAMMEGKFIKLGERFEKEKRESIENLKLIEAEKGNIEKELQDLRERPQRGNLSFDDLTEYKKE